MQAQVPQSYLFVPGSRPDRFEGALSSGADAVIIDLEDAVAPEDRHAARQTIAGWVSADRPVYVRINAHGTEWFEEDARLAALTGVAGIVLPKAESKEDIAAVQAFANNSILVLPLIETARGMWNVVEVATAAGVQRLMFGTLDFIAEMGMDDDREALNAYRSQLALTSRAFGLEPPIDGVTPDVHDLERLKGDTLNGKRYGFGAKLCIHPKQVSVVHACYQPSEQEIAWARSIESAALGQAGVIKVDGKMVDRPVVLRAQRLLAIAARRG